MAARDSYLRHELLTCVKCEVLPPGYNKFMRGETFLI
jgi:hypothetical protein